jgi:mono/diheme cytochrome c family protein
MDTAASILCTLGLVAAIAGTARAAPDDGDDLIPHGRYLVQTAGCNDCHTPGYAAAEGRVDEKLWLTGDNVGWSGPWGTTYAANLRLFMARHSEASWLQVARNFRPRPPMPWFNLHAMSERDLRALYRYIRSIGPAGAPAPDFVPPGGKPDGPLIRFPG